MNAYVLRDEDLQAFEEHLFLEEKSAATVEKYLRDARAFFRFAVRRDVTKELAVAYKRSLIERGYAVRSIKACDACLRPQRSCGRRQASEVQPVIDIGQEKLRDLTQPLRGSVVMSPAAPEVRMVMPVMWLGTTSVPAPPVEGGGAAIACR